MTRLSCPQVEAYQQGRNWSAVEDAQKDARNDRTSGILQSIWRNSQNKDGEVDHSAYRSIVRTYWKHLLRHVEILVKSDFVGAMRLHGLDDNVVQAVAKKFDSVWRAARRPVVQQLREVNVESVIRRSWEALANKRGELERKTFVGKFVATIEEIWKRREICASVVGRILRPEGKKQAQRSKQYSQSPSQARVRSAASRKQRASAADSDQSSSEQYPDGNPGEGSEVVDDGDEIANDRNGARNGAEAATGDEKIAVDKVGGLARVSDANGKEPPHIKSVASVDVEAKSGSSIGTSLPRISGSLMMGGSMPFSMSNE